MKHGSFLVTGCARLLVLALGLTAVAARADEYSEVSQSLREGRLMEAQARVERYLAAKPRDPQMRLFKGVIQRESGRTAEALATFTQLSEDYPELPEPYNNLAVILAAQGQYDKARIALEKALRTHPSYATAHNNLADLYARLASQAYSKALQIDGAGPPPPVKLALIRDLPVPPGKPPGPLPAAALATAAEPAPESAAARVSLTSPTPAQPAVVAAAPAAAPAPSMAAPAAPPAEPAAESAVVSAPVTPPTPARPVILAAAPVAVPAPSMSTPVAPPAEPAFKSAAVNVPVAPPAAATPVVVAAAPAAAPSSPMPAPAAKPPVSVAPPAAAPAAGPGASDSRREVEQAVHAWARAWADKNMPQYLAAYSQDFQTPGHVPRSAWEEDRRLRITGKSRITVTLLELQLAVNGNRAVAKFRQAYKADALAVVSRKTLELAKTGDRWLIVREYSGS